MEPKKTLILTIDMQGAPDWQIRALNKQMADWLDANKAVLPAEDLIIFPTTGETRLYWLQGEHNPADKKTLEEIKDRIQPVLEVALDIKIDKEKHFKKPDTAGAIAELNELRAKRSVPKQATKLIIPGQVPVPATFRRFTPPRRKK